MRLDKQIEEQIEKAMNINKQIDDMARDLCGDGVDCNKCAELMPCFSRHFSKRAVEKGYRKASDVAREIFEEIEKITMHNVTSSHGIWLMSMGEVAFAELKKKYTEGEG